MTYSKKRTCNGCKATIDARTGNICDLGISLEVSKRYSGLAIAYRPTEKCYKPKTNSEYIEIINKK